jgi:hypothetical protein
VAEVIVALLWALALVCGPLIALLAVANVGAAVLYLRSKQPLAWVPLTGSLLGVVAYLALLEVVPHPVVPVGVLALVLVSQVYRGRRPGAASAPINN